MKRLLFPVPALIVIGLIALYFHVCEVTNDDIGYLLIASTLTTLFSIAFCVRSASHLQKAYLLAAFAAALLLSVVIVKRTSVIDGCYYPIPKVPADALNVGPP